jgi:asparagine synthase (glutamine-hydrolysing)
MGGIFGCFGNRCNDISSILIEALDKSRGDLAHVIETPKCIMGLQAHHFEKDEDYSNDKIAMTFFSDSVKLDPRLIKSLHLSDGFRYPYLLLHTINADFSLALFDSDNRRAFLMCDITGIRKIFYTLVNGNLVYSSSLKHLISFLKKYGILKDLGKSIDIDALKVYLAYGATPMNSTFIKGIYKLQMGRAILFDINESNISKITISIPIQSFIKNEEKLIEKTYDLLRISIKEKSEILNGLLLSGGIDSGLIASILQNLCPSCQNVAVNVCYGSYSELQKARIISEYLGIKLVEVNVPLTRSWLRRSFDEGISFLDEPIARGNFIARYLALRELRKYTNVAFLGEGGDELFLGYWPSYWYWYRHPKAVLASHPLVRFLVKTLGVALGQRLNLGHINKAIDVIESSKDVNLMLMTWFMNTKPSVLRPLFTRSKLQDFIDEEIFSRIKQAPDIISKTSLFLFMLLTQSDVTVDENVCSRLGLKLKLPYLDPRVVRFAFSIDTRCKLKGKVTKYLLKKIAEHYNLLPREIIEQEKLGFTARPLFDEEFLLQELQELRFNINNRIFRDIIGHAIKFHNMSLMINAFVLCKWYEGMKKL